MINFYKVDQAPHTGWKFIGVEGSEIEELSNNELAGTILAYSYIPGSGEFYLAMTGIPELNKYQGKYTALVRSTDFYEKQVLYIRKDNKEIAELPWEETKQHYNVSGSQWREMMGKREGYYLSKKENPRTFIRSIFKGIMQAKREGKI